MYEIYNYISVYKRIGSGTGTGYSLSALSNDLLSSNNDDTGGDEELANGLSDMCEEDDVVRKPEGSDASSHSKLSKVSMKVRRKWPCATLGK